MSAEEHTDRQTGEIRFKKLESKQVKWEEHGEVIEGFYRGPRLTESELSKSGTAVVHDFVDGPEGPMFCYGTTVLDQRLATLCQPGDYLRITYVDDGEPKKRGFSGPKLFDVEVAENMGDDNN